MLNAQVRNNVADTAVGQRGILTLDLNNNLVLFGPARGTPPRILPARNEGARQSEGGDCRRGAGCPTCCLAGCLTCMGFFGARRFGQVGAHTWEGVELAGSAHSGLINVLGRVTQGVARGLALPWANEWLRLWREEGIGSHAVRQREEIRSFRKILEVKW